jgi:hypothetical protein
MFGCVALVTRSWTSLSPDGQTPREWTEWGVRTSSRFPRFSPRFLALSWLLWATVSSANPFLRSAQEALSRGDATSALAFLDKAESWQWRGQSTEAQVALTRGRVYMALKRPVSAKKAFAEALGLDSSVALPLDADGPTREIFAIARQEAASLTEAESQSQRPPVLDLDSVTNPTPSVLAPLSMERPPATLRVAQERVSVGARFQPLFYWHQVSGGGRSHRTPMALAGVRLDAGAKAGPLRLDAQYAFSWGGVYLAGRWVPAQVHDVTGTLGLPISTAGIRKNSRAIVDVGYTGTFSRFGTHFPSHLSNDNWHRARVGGTWQTAFYLWDIEAQAQLGVQVYPYARVFEAPVQSGDSVAGWGTGAEAQLQLPLAGRVLAVVGVNARWTLLGTRGVSSRPSFNLQKVDSVWQLLAMGSVGFLLPF